MTEFYLITVLSGLPFQSVRHWPRRTGCIPSLQSERNSVSCAFSARQVFVARAFSSERKTCSLFAFARQTFGFAVVGVGFGGPAERAIDVCAIAVRFGIVRLEVDRFI